MAAGTGKAFLCLVFQADVPRRAGGALERNLRKYCHRHQLYEGGRVMNRASLLQETTAWMDTVDFALCLFIYEVCNDCQFEYLSGSDFVNFLNLKPTSRPVAVRPKENLRICYMVLSVSRTIRPHERGRLWAEEFLKRCGISKSYYDKHRSDVRSKGTTKENQDFRKSIDKAVENARRLNNTP